MANKDESINTIMMHTETALDLLGGVRKHLAHDAALCHVVNTVIRRMWAANYIAQDMKAGHARPDDFDLVVSFPEDELL